MKNLTLTSRLFLGLTVLSLATGCSLIGIGTKTEKLDQLGVKVERPAAWNKTKVQSDEKFVDYVIDLPQKTDDKANVDGHIALNVSNPIGDEKINVDAELEGLKKYIGERITEMKVLEEKDVTFMGEKGKRLVLQFRNSEDRSIAEKIIITLTVKNNKAYAIILDEDLTDFDRFLPEYEKMATSMSFL